MGPFFKTKTVCKLVLNLVDVISLREQTSLKLVQKQLSLSHPLMCVTADCGVLQRPIGTKMVEKLIPFDLAKGHKSPLIGITVYPAVKSYTDYKKYKQTMAGVADYVIKQYNATIVFVPQWYGSFSDMPLINDIINQMQFKNRAYVTPESYHADEMHGIFGALDMIIATRYHSAVLASTMNVPCALIVYEHKASGFMHLLGLNDCILDIRELNMENLVSKVNIVWEKRAEIKMLLPAKVAQTRIRAQYNVKLAVALLQFYKKGSFDKSFKEYYLEKSNNDT